MALRPEPLSELLAQAERVFEGEVVQVLSEAPDAANDAPGRPGAQGRGLKAPEQRVRLRVTRGLRGVGTAELEAAKPLAPYTLRVGDRGVFFLRGQAILGRYGPDSYRLDQVEEALRSIDS